MTSQQPIVKVIAALVGVLVVALGCVCGYQYWVMGTTRQQINTQRLKSITAKRQLTEHNQQATERGKLAQQVVPRRASWSWSDQLPLMVGQVTRITDKQGAKIDTLQPEPMVAKQQMARFPLRVTLNADLAKVTGVLAEVQQANPMLAVDHLNIRAGQNAGDPLQVELTLSSYVMLEGGKAKGGKQ